MTTQEIIVNAIVFVCGWVLKRPALVESVVAKLFTKKAEAVKPETPKKGK